LAKIRRIELGLEFHLTCKEKECGYNSKDLNQKKELLLYK